MPVAIRKRTKNKKLRKPLPVCPVHGWEMKVVSSPPGIRYCRCPEPGCCETKTQSR